MPISKSGKKYFTQNQYEAALAASALEYARRQGYDLVGHGNRYHLREHDSMIFLADGRWYWNSRGLSGRAFDFCREYEGRGTLEAVLLLAGEDERIGSIPTHTNVEEPPVPFCPPENTTDATGILVKYLTVRRCCDTEIVRELLRQKRIYINCRKAADNQVFRNAVFISYDEHGVPCAAILRGINYGSQFKGIVPGSDKSVAWELPGKPGADVVAIFEAPIDAISHATLEKQAGIEWQKPHRLALAGNPAPGTVSKWLSYHPEIQTIKMCFDSDEAGRSFAKQLPLSVSFTGQIVDLLPPSGKDWNEYLVALTKRKDFK